MRIGDWRSDVCSSDLGAVIAWQDRALGKGDDRAGDDQGTKHFFHGRGLSGKPSGGWKRRGKGAGHRRNFIHRYMTAFTTSDSRKSAIASTGGARSARWSIHQTGAGKTKLYQPARLAHSQARSSWSSMAR